MADERTSNSSTDSSKENPSTEPQANHARALEERARSLLAERANQLDARTQSRLTQARHAALDAVRQPAPRSNAWWLPASGVAAAAGLAAILIFNANNGALDQHETVAASAPIDDVEIVTAEDSLEFYRDVEFYAWLDMVLEDEPEEPSGA